VRMLLRGQFQHFLCLVEVERHHVVIHQVFEVFHIKVVLVVVRKHVLEPLQTFRIPLEIVL